MNEFEKRNKTAEWRPGPEGKVLKGQELSKELNDMIDLINMAIDQLNTPNSDDIFLKLGEMVATHNKDKVGFVETCLIEEMSELTKALCKIRRGKVDFDNTIEELGHVILMCYALISKYSFNHKTVIKEAEDAVAKMKAEEAGESPSFCTLPYIPYRGIMKNENN